MTHPAECFREIATVLPPRSTDFYHFSGCNLMAGKRMTGLNGAGRVQDDNRKNGRKYASGRDLGGLNGDRSVQRPGGRAMGGTAALCDTFRVAPLGQRLPAGHVQPGPTLPPFGFAFFPAGGYGPPGQRFLPVLRRPTRARIVRAFGPGKGLPPVTSLVLPAYNPGPGVEATWRAVAEFLDSRPGPWEAVFVLDGCSDGTADRLARLAARRPDPRLRVVDYAPNRGKGHAVRVGLLAARGAHRLFTDIDLAYPFEDVARVADALRAGAAVAIASRDHPESQLHMPAAVLPYAYRRHLQSRVFGAAARALLPIAQRDTQAGLKGMTAIVAEHVVPELRCDGFGFDCELLTACARSAIPVTEVPVTVRYENTASTTGGRATLRMVRELWAIRRSWRGRRVSLPAARPEPMALPKAA